MTQKADSFFNAQWLSAPEGQLAIDVHETPTHLIVRSAIAGVCAGDLDITLSDDTLTIRGARHLDTKTQKNQTTHVQECHWGAFSRSVILPSRVDPDRVNASLKRGILTIKLKKVGLETTVPVEDVEDE